MNTTQTKIFLSIGKTLSFSKTADELFISQSTASKNIKRLENELNVPLISREHRKIKLTKQGEYFYVHLKQLNSFFEDTVKHIQDETSSMKHTVKIGFTNLPFERKFLSIFLNDIQKSTDINIELIRVPLSHKDVSTMFQQNLVDFVLYQSDSFSNYNLDFIPVISAGFSVIINRNNPLAKYKKIPLSELENYKVFLWDAKESLKSINLLKDAIELYSVHNKLDLNIIHKISDGVLLASSELGITIVPSFAYDHNNPDIYYRYLDYDEKINYGIGFLKQKRNDPNFKIISSKLIRAILVAQREWK